jgi:4-hydroxy 2-oxovalerate aldolase
MISRDSYDPSGIKVAVLLNGAALCTDIGCFDALERPALWSDAEASVDLVRFACHFNELPKVLQAGAWLIERVYRVGSNLIQLADRTCADMQKLTG